MSFAPFLLDVSTTIAAGSGSAETTAATTSTNPISSLLSGNPVLLIVGYCLLLVVVMYFFSVRPNQKREKALAEQRSAIEIGDSVITNSGLFGKVVDITHECFIIEFGTNKGVRIPMLKSEVFGKREPNLSNEAPPVIEAPKKKGLFGFGG